MDRKNLTVSSIFNFTYRWAAFCYSGKMAGFLLLLFLLLCSFTTIAAADVAIIGSWVSGTSHSEETGTDRALVFTAHAESSSADTDLGSVTYGGQSMTKVVEKIYGSGYIAYTCAFILDEAGISAASGSSFVVSWNTAPSRTPEFSSVFLQDVNQTSLTGATGVGGSETTTAETPALSTSNGDMAIVAGTCGNSGVYSTINGFTEAIELTIASADGIAGYLSSSGGNVTPGVSHDSVNRQSVIGFVVNADTAPVPPGQASNETPNNNDTNVSINADLSWAAGSGATSHDVYFGTSNPPASQGNQTETTFDPGTMNIATTYYWRIDEVNAYGTTTGTVWNFTTTSNPDIYDVTDYGATGNGSTLDSPAINAAIAAADANGGGTVYFPTGTYKSGSIIMKDNITLNLHANAIIKATMTYDYSSVDPNPWDDYQDWGHSHWKSSLIWGVGIDNVGITGSGLIDGSNASGDTGLTKGPDAPDGFADRTISFKNCSGIVIKDVTIHRAGHFAIITSGCNDIEINNVLIDTNRDGMNIDCCNDVNIVNCTVNAPQDDAICMKSSYCLGYKRPTENVNISNCTVMGHAVGYLLPQFPNGSEGWHAGRIKFGTESNGGFKNITITDCNFEYCFGFMLATVDGGDIENIYIDNIQMTDLFSPAIFMRLGNRARGPGPPPPGIYRNVNISNITAEDDHSISSIMSGMPGHLIEDVNFSNINIAYPGGGPAVWADTVLGENESGSPDAFMFGTITPSYAFYIRHAIGVEFHDCDFSFDINDERPAFVLIDVNGFELDNVDAERYYTSGDHIKFDDVDDVNIHDCTDFPAVTATYGAMQVSPLENITAGEPFAVITTATSSSDGICTTDLFADSNYLDSEYTWLNGSVPEDVNLDGLKLEQAGHYLMEIDTQDLIVDIYPVGDFDFSGNVDFGDQATFAKDWLKETGQISLTGDPVAWWKFEEGDGSYAYDSSVNSNTGTLHNMTSGDWVTGYDGGALDFDGSDDYISVNDSASISVGGGDYTLCAWIYPHSISGDRGIVAKVKSNADKEYAFSLGNDGAQDGALVLDVEVGANDGAESTDAVVIINEWQHVMVVFDSAATDATFYYNFDPVPVVSDSITAAHVTSDDNLCIGRWGGSYNDKEFDGVIDDVRIYNYKLQSVPSSQADFNEDGIVDSTDLDIFLNNWLAEID